MKLMTVLGTRPEIIRLSRVIPKLDRLFEHIVVHTGQNYDRTLNQVFFEELSVRPPNHMLDCRSESLMTQIGFILSGCEKIIALEKPDRLLVLGDTNSGLSAMVAKRHGIPVFHMEAGNRCYDDRVPEEVNRRVIDHCSDVLMPYTERSRANLLAEGFPGRRIFVTGNPITEVLEFYAPIIDGSPVLKKMSLQPGGYFLVTLHRAENVDVGGRLGNFIKAFHMLHELYKFPVVCSLHPRTKSQLSKQGTLLEGTGVTAFEPLGLFDFVKLEKNALCVLSDSGTVQEECCILKVPSVTLRDVTERPETVEAGSNLISGCEPSDIISAVQTVLDQSCGWNTPGEYMAKEVSSTVIKILAGKIPI